MNIKTLNRRKELASSLLTLLKETYFELEEASLKVGSSSDSCYEKVFKEKRDELSALMDDYSKNVERIKQINNEIVSTINRWYQFIKDEDQTEKIFFPIRYFLGKRSLKKKIVMLNEELSSITINNRFLRGKFSELEHQLEEDAILYAKLGDGYREYENILERQKSIVRELKYLLPTIPGACPADISPEAIDSLLKNIAA